MDILTPGNHVWLHDNKQVKAARVEKVENNQVILSHNYGETVSYPVKVAAGLTTAMHSTSIHGVEDMSKLSDLHEAAILNNLQIRYKVDNIYTYISSILVAVNPYKAIESIYDMKTMERYNKKHIGDISPHIYAIANECYYSMWKSREHQCVLISGESGAGKTESTKFILSYLSEMSQAALVDMANKDINVEKAILQSSPILEAFGNAKTIYNNNSSRFGKFIQLQFSEKGNIAGGKIKDFLLEKNRVVGQNPQERNYHIFYSLLAGASPEMQEKLKLSSANAFHYLNQSGCITDEFIDDKTNFDSIMEAMRVMRFREDEIMDIFQVLSAVLHIGNMDFITAGGAQISDKGALETVAGLLHLDEYQLNDVMTQKSMILRGEEILTPLEIDQAKDSRDSLAMNLYARCFEWIIKKINCTIKGSENFCSIGVLDIFGFENFEVNRFEQFNINYANEKLQEYFNKHIFSLEQHEYNTEGIRWVDIDWSDNCECLDLVQRKLGILALIDEESRFPKGTDQSMLTKLHRAHYENAYYIKPRITNSKFGIKHYAGDVFYESNGFLEKNRDTFRDDLLMALKESRSDFIYDLFENVKALKANNTKTIRKKATVSAQFKESLNSLMNTLSSCNPYFVRCIKPNSKKLPEIFEAQLVMNQLKYSGMLETVKIRRAGFPVRRCFEDFVRRYKMLIPSQHASEEMPEICLYILEKYDENRKNWQLGKTKVFLREQLEYQLEVEREKQLHAYATVIQAYTKMFVSRKKFRKIVFQIVAIQKTFRAYFYRKQYLRTRKAIIRLQCFGRSIMARNVYLKKLEEKRIEEERIREEQRKREEEERREMERLEQEKKIRELEELKKKLEEEARLKREREEEQKRKEEEERQAAIIRVRQLEEARRLEEEEARRKISYTSQLKTNESSAWKFIVHGRKNSYHLHTLSYDESWRWVCAIQDVIDSKPPIETPTQLLINDLREAASENNTALINQIYSRNPILRNTPHTLKAPLLPLPYGQIASTDLDKGYTSLQEEAVKIFSTLQGSENVGDPVPVIQGIMQTCHDLRPLRDEVYCQLIKQTTGIQDVDSLNNLRNWQIMACMSCTFLPSRKIQRYLRFHLLRQIEAYPDSQVAKYAQYAVQTLKRTRTREYVPSREEIMSCLARREMNATVYCYGGGSCKISINSATSAGQVITTLLKGMSLEKSNNRFALFEKCGSTEKVIEERTILADILAKFEQYKHQGIGEGRHQWQLFFKLHCFMDTTNVDKDTIEYSFMFEQAHEQVIQGQFPASEDMLQHLAALRIQFVKGDYATGTWIDDMGSYYCLDKLHSSKPIKEKENESPVRSQEKRENFLVGTLRGLGRGTLRKLQKASSDDSLLVDEVFKEDLSAVTTAVTEKWKTLKGLSADEAQEKYMAIVKQWSGYGATIFNVVGKEGIFLGELWLAISSKMIAFYRRGDTKPIDEFTYEKILSFGAPLDNEYRIVVEGHKTPFIFETTYVFEIAKLMKSYINEIVKKRHSIAMDDIAMNRAPVSIRHSMVIDDENSLNIAMNRSPVSLNASNHF
uniref:Unconventional myosin-X-like n=1 Tax=Saccoglossus kowalevskii TaxID=10224 RepID=A0ABM0MHW5_SACKO|nr:PREDICTED: unconventional myosin-X-like [Saccoglossus kowalevskii]